MVNFMNDITNEIFKQQRNVNYDMIIKDIIEIYNECYSSYEDYCKSVNQYNECIDEYNNKQIYSIGNNDKYSIIYYPKRIILDRDFYDAIIRFKNFIYC